MTTKSYSSRNLPPSGSTARSKSERWVQRELAIAAKNAEINRAIEIPINAKDRRNRDSATWKVFHASSIETLSNSILKTEHGAMYIVENSPIESGYAKSEPQAPIQSFVDGWSNAMVSIFSEKQHMKQYTRIPDSNVLVLL